MFFSIMKLFYLLYKYIKSILNNIFLYFSVPYCIFCDKKIDDGIICKECEKLKEYINKSYYCYRCGSNIERNSDCAFCNDFYNYKYIRTIVKYDTIIRPIIIGLKYEKKLECSDYIIKDILDHIPKEYENVKFDYITCVPTHYFRYIFRGYKHTEYLSKKLSNILNIPFKNFIKRSKYVKSQTQIKHIKRYTNVKNSFELNSSFDLKNKNILVLEDVITTGSTLKEYIRELSKTKANIYILVYADARHESRGL